MFLKNEKKTEALKKKQQSGDKPDERQRSNNKFQNFSDKKGNAPRGGPQQQKEGLSKLGKPKHQKRKEERAAGIEKTPKVKSDAKPGAAKDARIPKRKQNELARKKAKKMHVGTNKKGASRFNI